jgi:hypothetical protein
MYVNVQYLSHSHNEMFSAELTAETTITGLGWRYCISGPVRRREYFVQYIHRVANGCYGW